MPYDYGKPISNIWNLQYEISDARPIGAYAQAWVGLGIATPLRVTQKSHGTFWN